MFKKEIIYRQPQGLVDSDIIELDVKYFLLGLCIFHITRKGELDDRLK